MKEFVDATTGQIIKVSKTVLSHFDRSRQSGSKSKEAGGQLFALIDDNIIFIEQATGPRPSDRRTPLSFIPNRLAERSEIRRLFKKGLHYVGDWHTHPEAKPRPSSTDERSINETFRKSRHQLDGFILAIVGTDPLPSGLFIGVTDGKSLTRLTANQSPERVGSL